MYIFSPSLCVSLRWPYPFLELNTPWAPVWYVVHQLWYVSAHFNHLQLPINKERIKILTLNFILRIHSCSYFGLALVHIPCYWIYTLVVKAKCSIFTRLFPRAFVRLHSWAHIGHTKWLQTKLWSSSDSQSSFFMLSFCMYNNYWTLPLIFHAYIYPIIPHHNIQRKEGKELAPYHN